MMSTVLVIYCLVINYRKLHSLKQHTFITAQVSRLVLTESSVGVSQGCNQSVLSIDIFLFLCTQKLAGS